jgi:hypothetical protein
LAIKISHLDKSFTSFPLTVKYWHALADDKTNLYFTDYWFLLRYTVIIYIFTQGNLGAKKIARSRFESPLKKKNCKLRHWRPTARSLAITQHETTQIPTYMYMFNYIKEGKPHHCCNGLVSVLASSAVDRGFESQSGQTNDYEIGICCFSAKHTVLRRKNKDWLARNQNNLSEWCEMSINKLLFQWASTTKIQLSVLF